MRSLGGVRFFALAIVAAIAASACAAAPAPGKPQLRVIQGGSGVPATAAPSVSPVPEPPVGVIMSGRVVIACDYGTRCAYFALISPISPERPDPTVSPSSIGTAVALEGVDGQARGFGPTARSGHPADHEPADTAQLVAGIWHIDAWTTMVGQAPPRLGQGGERGSCGMDFVLKPGDSLSIRLASLDTGCSIRLARGAIP
jgi:hypothetical protein